MSGRRPCPFEEAEGHLEALPTGPGGGGRRGSDPTSDHGPGAPGPRTPRASKGPDAADPWHRLDRRGPEVEKGPGRRPGLEIAQAPESVETSQGIDPGRGQSRGRGADGNREGQGVQEAEMAGIGQADEHHQIDQGSGPEQDPQGVEAGHGNRPQRRDRVLRRPLVASLWSSVKRPSASVGASGTAPGGIDEPARRVRPGSKRVAKAKKKRERQPASPLTRRNRIPVAVSAVFALVVLAAAFPAATLISQHRQQAADAAELHQLRHQNQLLAEQERALASKTEINRIARQEYQLVSPGQDLYEVLAGRRATDICPEGPSPAIPAISPSCPRPTPRTCRPTRDCRRWPSSRPAG